MVYLPITGIDDKYIEEMYDQIEEVALTSQKDIMAKYYLEIQKYVIDGEII